MDPEIAKVLAERLHKKGQEYFRGVGGSMVQLFLKRNFAEDYVYLADNGKSRNCSNIMTHHGRNVKEILKFSNLDSMQIRMIVNPKVLLNSRRARVYHYPSNEAAFESSRQRFRKLIREEIKVEVIKEVEMVEESNTPPSPAAPQNPIEQTARHRKHGLIIPDFDECDKKKKLIAINPTNQLQGGD